MGTMTFSTNLTCTCNDIFNMIDMHNDIFNIITEMHDDIGNMIDMHDDILSQCFERAGKKN